MQNGTSEIKAPQIEATVAGKEEPARPIAGRKPVCGILSISMPLIGPGLIYAAVSLESLGGLIFAVLACLALFFVGVVLSIIGIARREKVAALSLIALIINATLLILVYSANPVFGPSPDR